MKRLLLFTLLASLSCGRMATDHLLSKNFHGWLEPYKVLPEDASRLEQGWLPLLVLMDGKPCPNALTRMEPIPTISSSFPEYLIASTGLRLRVFGPDESGIMRTDSRGIVWWQPDKNHQFWHLSACSGERVGFYGIQQGRLEDFRAAARHGLAHQAIELLPMGKWRVEVRVHDGIQPNDIPLFLASPEGRVLTRMGWSGAGTVSSFYLEDEILGEDDEFMQILAGFDRSQMQRVDAGGARSSLDFDLSQTGGLAVELIGADGRPMTEPRAVFLEELDADAADDWSGMASQLADVPSVVAADGSATLRGVPLGKRWRISAFLLSDHAAVMQEVDGPVQPGEIVTVRLDAGETSVPFRGRILEPDGSPAANAVCWLNADAGVFTPLQTDAEGQFSIQVPLWIPRRVAELRIECRRWPVRPTCSAYVPVKHLAPGAEVKEWRWKEAELLAMGRVVDETEAGVAWARPSGLFVNTLSECNGEGLFLLETDNPPYDKKLDLDADSPWHLEESISFRAGDRDLVVRVRTGARISGILKGAVLVPNIYWKFLLPGSDKILDENVMHDWKGLHGEFEIGPIPPEATEVQINFGTNDETIGTVTLKDLRLEAGKVYRLPKPVQLDK